MKAFKLHIWFYFGLLGFASFLFLNPLVDFNAGAPINESVDGVRARTVELAQQLGMEMDSLATFSFRAQHVDFYQKLQKDAEKLGRPHQLNERGANLNSWRTIIGKENRSSKILASSRELYENMGIAKFGYGSMGRIFEFETNPDFRNPTFIPGDSLFSVARNIVQNLFGYNLSDYQLEDVAVSDTVLTIRELPDDNRIIENSNGNGANLNRTVFKWRRSQMDGAGPEQIELALNPKIREVTENFETRIEYGASIASFSAYNSSKAFLNSYGASGQNYEAIPIYIGIILLILAVLYLGLRQLFRGEVEWRRALLIQVIIMVTFFGWRLLYFSSTYGPFLDGSTDLVLMLNQLLVGAVLGLFIALAYSGWEATARHQGQTGIPIIDALWRKHFFLRETGESMVRGYALGGILLGVSVVLIYALDQFYYQADSSFGFAEPSVKPKLISINFTILLNTIVVGISQVAITATLLNELVKKQIWAYYLAGALFMGLFLSSGGTVFKVSGPIYMHIGVMVVLGLMLLASFRNFGLLTTAIGWGVLTGVILIMPYWGSQDLKVATVAWGELTILSLPLLFGFISYRYGGSIANLEGYVPEYEEKMANHLRVEKEVEIARESQFALLPVKPPQLDGVDVFGFFIPSFEVGGDYFDYVVNDDRDGNPNALTMTVVDVSGKAMKAAIHAVFTSGLLLSRLKRDMPCEILSDVAPTLFHKTDPKTFITCLIARYEPVGRRLQIGNAGHCMPILKRDGKARFLKTPDPKYPLGLQEQVQYQSEQVMLEKGDFVLLYSDGLPEAVNQEGERYGFDTTRELLEQLDTDTLTSQEIAKEIKRIIQRFSDYQLADDTTIICFKVTG